MRVWIVGRAWSNGRAVSTWEVLGAYSLRELAVDRCEVRSDFIAELEVDEDLPDEHRAWPGAVYPLEEVE